MVDEDEIPESVKRGVEKAMSSDLRPPTRTPVVETRRLKKVSKFPRQKFDTYGFPPELLKPEKPEE